MRPRLHRPGRWELFLAHRLRGADADERASGGEAWLALKSRDHERRAVLMECIWWAQLPLVCGVYWFVSSEPPIEKAILVYLAAVSIIAIAVTYGSKAEAARAKKAADQD